jgi:hypothetical protein
VISSFSETAGDFLYVTVNYVGATNVISSVTAGSVSASRIGGEFENSQSVAFYDVTSEPGGTVTVTVTLNTAEYGSCRAGQLSPGTTVGMVGAGNSTASGTSLSLTNAATHEPSLLLALFGNTRPSGSWGPLSPSGAWYDGPNPGTGTTSLGTGSGLVGYNDTASGTVTFTLSTAYAVSISGIAVEFYLQGPPTYYGYTGYDGNATIYPTLDTTATPLPLLSHFSYQTASNSSLSAGSGEGLVNSNLLKVSNLSYEAPRYGDLGSQWYNEFEIWVWAVSTGGAEPFDVFPQECNNEANALVDYAIDITATPSGLPSGSSNLFAVGNNTGMNTTHGNLAGDTGNRTQLLSGLIGLGLDAASVFFPEAGIPLSIASVGLDLASIGPDGPESNSYVTSNPDPGNQAANEVALVTNTTISNGCESYNAGSNIFSSAAWIQDQVAASGLSLIKSGSSLAISSYTDLEFADSYAPSSSYTVVGANPSISYPIAPAVSIGSTVELYPGTAANSAQVLLQQTCSGNNVTNFELKTNSVGYWHFFANPACSYTESASRTNPYQGGTLTSPTVPLPAGVLVQGGNFSATTPVAVPVLNLAGGLVTFTESGLPNGWSWSVTLNGVEQGSTAGDSPITFLEPNNASGSPYPFTVTPLAGETATPPSGHVTVYGDNSPESISFTPNDEYTVTISESGLPSGTDWSATVGSTQSSSTGTSIAFTGLPNGNYQWSVPAVGSYAPNPSGGSVTVDGGNAEASTAFQESGHGGGCVAFGTPILTPTGYASVQSLKAGDAVEEYNFASQHLVQGTFLSGNTTNVTQLIDVNNGWLYVTPTEQPIYIENGTFVGWLHDPQNLTTSDRILDPVTYKWVSVTSVELIVDHTVVFDVVTNGANNFVANGALLDLKT